MLLNENCYEKYLNRYHVPSKKNTEEEKEINRRACILRGAIDLMLDIRNMGIHGVEDTADEVQKPMDKEMLNKVNEVLVRYMLEDEPLLTQGQPVGILLSMYNIAFTWLRLFLDIIIVHQRWV